MFSHPEVYILIQPAFGIVIIVTHVASFFYANVTYNISFFYTNVTYPPGHLITILLVLVSLPRHSRIRSVQAACHGTFYFFPPAFGLVSLPRHSRIRSVQAACHGTSFFVPSCFWFG